MILYPEISLFSSIQRRFVLLPVEDAEDSCLQMINCSGPWIHCFSGSLLNEGLQHSCDVLLNRNFQTPDTTLCLKLIPN